MNNVVEEMDSELQQLVVILRENDASDRFMTMIFMGRVTFNALKRYLIQAHSLHCTHTQTRAQIDLEVAVSDSPNCVSLRMVYFGIHFNTQQYCTLQPQAALLHLSVPI